MRPLSSFSSDDEPRPAGLFFDLDDTFLTHGVLTREAYDALWDLRDAGMRLVAVTGRPSGWAEVFVRQWPIDGAVTENGPVFVVRDGPSDGAGANPLRSLGKPGGVALIGAEPSRAKLDELVARVAAKFPDIHLADDVHMRRSDVTWDIGERFVVPEDRIRDLGAFVVAAGARTTRSTVHLHGSFEGDDKASGAIRFVRERFGDDPGTAVSRWAFIGDSPNDAACFAALRTTFGVANVRAFASKISVPPRWIASKERGAGFAEIARALLAARPR